VTLVPKWIDAGDRGGVNCTMRKSAPTTKSAPYASPSTCRTPWSGRRRSREELPLPDGSPFHAPWFEVRPMARRTTTARTVTRTTECSHPWSSRVMPGPLPVIGGSHRRRGRPRARSRVPSACAVAIPAPRHDFQPPRREGNLGRSKPNTGAECFPQRAQHDCVATSITSRSYVQGRACPGPRALAEPTVHRNHCMP
jgi:hypothetical protein